MTYEDHKELIDAFRQRYHDGFIAEIEFRAALARNGFNATEIQSEVQSIRQQLNEEYLEHVRATVRQPIKHI